MNFSKILVDQKKYGELIGHDIPSIVYDKKGLIEWVSHSFCKLTGYTSDIVGKHTNVLLTAEYRNRHKEFFGSNSGTMPNQKKSMPLVTSNGEPMNVIMRLLEISGMISDQKTAASFAPSY